MAAARSLTFRHAFPMRPSLALLLVLAGLGLAVFFAWTADDFYHEDDICHYLLAHDGRYDVDAALHVWGRPGFTLPMMGADALGGLRGCRVLSALLTGLTSLLAFGIAREITKDDPVGGRLAWLAPALVWLQPLVLTLAQTTLTETPAALYVTFAVWLALRRRPVAAAAVVSLLFVTRIETVVFAPLLALGLLRTPNPIRGWIALAWAPTAWILAVVLLRVSPEASPFVLLERSYVDAYGTGPWHHFAVRWLIAAGVGVLALAAAGTLHAGKRAWLPAGAALAGHPGEPRSSSAPWPCS